MPITMTLQVESFDPNSSFNAQYFFPGNIDDGDTLVNLYYAPTFFYIDDSTSHLVMKSYARDDIVGKAYVDTDDKGILKFSKDPSRKYGEFAIRPQDETLSLRGADDRWFWCPWEGQANGTVAIGTTAGEGCEELKYIRTGATD